MSKKFASLAVAAAAAVALVSAPAQAATVNYNFSFTTVPGFAPASSTPGTGSFSYDDSLVTGGSFEFVPVQNFVLNFLGNALTPAQGNGSTAVSFANGSFLGINFTTPRGFTLPGSSPTINKITLAENTAFVAAVGGLSSTSDIAYARVTEVIPTPALLPALVGFGAAALRNRKKEQAA
jgi:hypothetical protein